MAQHGRPALRPEEKVVALVLQRVFPGASVEQHDDGSEASQYDLQLSGPVCGAVEVGLVTDAGTRRAQAHWRRALDAHRTADLRWSWTFIFSEVSDAASPLRFPHLARPDSTELTAVLARLEGRGIMRAGRMWDHVTVEPSGWRIADPDMADLFCLLGRTAENGSAVDLSHHGEIGGWSFAFSFGHTSSADPDRFAAEVEALVLETARADMVAKLERSGRPVRVAALLFDSTTGVGWSTRHLSPGTASWGANRRSCARALRDPAFDNEIWADLVGIEAQVVGTGLHARHRTAHPTLTSSLPPRPTLGDFR